MAGALIAAATLGKRGAILERLIGVDSAPLSAVLLLAAGLVLLLAGVLFFFAFNWSALHRYARLALAAAPLSLHPPLQPVTCTSKTSAANSGKVSLKLRSARSRRPAPTGCMSM